MPYQYSGHKLKRNHSTPIPRYVLAVDTNPRSVVIDEQGKHIRDVFSYGHLFIGRIRGSELSGIFDSDFDTKHDFWRMVYAASGSRHTLWVVGHNILYHLTLLGLQTEMDHSVIVLDRPRKSRKINDQVDQKEQYSGICCLESPPTILGVRCVATQGRIVFVDIQNYFTGSIYELRRNLDCNFDSDQSMVDWNVPLPCLTRLKAKIVFHTFTDLCCWVKAMDLGVFKYTAAGQSMNAFRHRFMKHDILIHDNAEVKALERRGNFGGRTEVFKHGRIDETVYQYDVNALYPYVMANGKFPRSLLRYDLSCNQAGLPPDVNPSDCIASVTISGLPAIFPQRRYPFVCYPAGEFRTVLAGQELQSAIDMQGVKRVHSWAVYDCDYIFATFVAELWALRQDYQRLGQRQYASFVKMLMNCLYGKFGQKRPEWEDCDDMCPPCAWAEWAVLQPNFGEPAWYRSVGWSVQRKQSDLEMASSFVAIPAFVTAAARCYMNVMREKAGVNNVYYQGCDSIITNERGSQRIVDLGIVDGRSIGLLKLECVGNFAEIYGTCDYRIGDKVVISGRKGIAEYAADSELVQRKRAGKAALFTGESIDYSDEITLPWTRKDGYAKGIIGSRGWVQPIICTGDS